MNVRYCRYENTKAGADVNSLSKADYGDENVVYENCINPEN